MNTKWLKQNAVLLGLLTAFVAVLGGLIWLQHEAAGKRSEVDSLLEDRKSELGHLQATKPSPSRQNIAILKLDREQLDALYTNLLAAVSQHQIQAQEVPGPVAFLQLMASTFAHLRQSADTAGVKLPEGFAFGFSRYAGPTPTLPTATKEVLGQLAKQLRAIEKLSELLMDSHVDEITQIQRAEVEPASPSSDALRGSTGASSKGLYQTLPFEFQFACSTPALRTFLNKLSQSEWFFAVRRVEIAGEPPASASDQGPPSPAAPTATTPAPRPAPLHVTVHIDLVEFPSTPPAKPKP
ncbi:MAG TPA: Amuc_1100 family pilus-like protein [Verrucomicrobiae bacterium]|nr:Amuc_1100 family pilus-like protein [Verrucomicrobiae bacterium]